MSSGTRIPLARAEEIARAWVDRLSPFCDRVEVAGSIRRRRPDVGDIEIVALPRLALAREVQALLGTTLLSGMTPDERDRYRRLPTGPKAQGQRREFARATALVIAARLSRPCQFWGGWPGRYTQLALPEGVVLDLFTPLPQAWALVFMIRTGSDGFSRGMLARAVDLGYVSEDGLVYRRSAGGKPEGRPVPLAEERDVFELYQVPWVTPEERIDVISLVHTLEKAGEGIGAALRAAFREAVTKRPAPAETKGAR